VSLPQSTRRAQMRLPHGSPETRGGSPPSLNVDVECLSTQHKRLIRFPPRGHGPPGRALVRTQVCPIPHPGRYIYTRTETPLHLRPRTEIHLRNEAVLEAAAGSLIVFQGRSTFEMHTHRSLPTTPTAGSHSLSNLHSQVKKIHGSGRWILCGSYNTTGSGK